MGLEFWKPKPGDLVIVLIFVWGKEQEKKRKTLDKEGVGEGKEEHKIIA